MVSIHVPVHVQVKSDQGKQDNGTVNFGTTVGSYICEGMTSYAFGWLRHAEIVKERRASQEGE